MANRLNGARSDVVFLMPLRGVSAIDAEGMPFWWPEADRSLLDALESNLNTRVRLVKVEAHINDESFGYAAAGALLKLMDLRNVVRASCP